MTAIALRDHIVSALEDLKGQDILALDVTQLTPITDFMVLASGTSNRHVKALVDQVIEAGKASGARVGARGRTEQQQSAGVSPAGSTAQSRDNWSERLRRI